MSTYYFCQIVAFKNLVDYVKFPKQTKKENWVEFGKWFKYSYLVNPLWVGEHFFFIRPISTNRSHRVINNSKLNESQCCTSRGGAQPVLTTRLDHVDDSMETNIFSLSRRRRLAFPCLPISEWQQMISVKLCFLCTQVRSYNHCWKYYLTSTPG